MIATYPNLIKASSSKVFSQSLQVIGGALFIAICSQVRIPLPYSIVPLTLQTFAVLLLGGMFGSRKSCFMVLVYFAQILMSWPVLAGGHINPLALFGPKGGYLLGFLVQAYCMGWILENIRSFSFKASFWAGLVSCALQLGLGVCWLSQFVGLDHALIMGLYPFIPGEILKVLAVGAILKKYHLGKQV